MCTINLPWKLKWVKWIPFKILLLFYRLYSSYCFFNQRDASEETFHKLVLGSIDYFKQCVANRTLRACAYISNGLTKKTADNRVTKYGGNCALAHHLLCKNSPVPHSIRRHRLTAIGIPIITRYIRSRPRHGVSFVCIITWYYVSSYNMI